MRKFGVRPSDLLAAGNDADGETAEGVGQGLQ
ncbi:MAG: hypothetical protein ACI9K5_003426, partial [Gammaproteobacteria bacterium]